MLPRSIIFFSLITLILFSKLSPSLSKTQNDKVEDDDDLSFVDDENDKNGAASHDVRYPGFHQFEGYEIDGDEFDDYSDFDDSEKEPEIDDTDVVVLKERNFSGFIDKLKFVMVEFYSPWCAHCQALAPEYAEAAAELKEEGVVLAKVDATEETELALEYDIQGYPTIYFFVDGVHKLYTGERSKDAIVTWIKRKIGPAIHNITTLDDAERVLTSDSKLVLSYLNSLVGPESEELAAASRLEDDVNFYQTVNPDVAKLFHFDPKVKRPALILIKKEAEKLSYFDGNFSKLEIIEFVLANKLPLVTTFTRESAASVFENPIKKQLLLFATSNDSEKIIPIFQEAAKLFKGKLIFVYVALDNEEVGKPVADYFGASGNEPTVVAYTGNDDSRKFVLSEEVSLDKIKTFAEEFLEDQLKPFFKSDPIPETNYGDVKIVVGNNFDELVLDESKDVLLEIYAPWCGHCQTLEPTYNKLAKHLRGIKSLVIAKMDGTRNEHPRAKADGYPTILFFPAGNKSFEPLTVDTDRTVVALYKFIKEHASIPFKLRKPASTPKSKSSSDAEGSQKSSIKNVKDEL